MRQLDLLSWHPPPAAAPQDGTPFDDIAEAWLDLTGEPYPGRARALAQKERAPAREADALKNTGDDRQPRSHPMIGSHTHDG